MVSEITGYLCAFFIGISLGTLGSGGSILTVPIMVYLMHISPVKATGYSLFVVGITSVIGWLQYVRKGLVHIKTAAIFAAPSLLSVFLTRRYIIPLVPDVIFSMHHFVLHKNLFILLLFATLMIVVAYHMIRKPDLTKIEKENIPAHFNYIFVIGFLTGILTGIVGVGGGFLIIPALVLFARIPIKMSVGTSLMVIAANALVGFAGELSSGSLIEWGFLFRFSLCSIGGIFIGFSVAKRIPAEKLKPAFGWFVLCMGIAIFLKEFFLT
jgi:uncharacterized membrane protein YfcA